jgi:hypothetical protein
MMMKILLAVVALLLAVTIPYAAEPAGKGALNRIQKATGVQAPGKKKRARKAPRRKPIKGQPTPIRPVLPIVKAVPKKLAVTRGFSPLRFDAEGEITLPNAVLPTAVNTTTIVPGQNEPAITAPFSAPLLPVPTPGPKELVPTPDAKKLD